MEDPLRDLALKDGRYSPEAFRFLFESLDWAQRLAGKENAQGADRHITGQELLAGMREHAKHAFGPLAAQVWRAWGVARNRDWGEVVFLLVDARMLARRDTDTREDFADETDFEREFVTSYRPRLDGPVPGTAGDEPGESA
jgi:uncharacterized repeat protein (TIGR04138 family)